MVPRRDSVHFMFESSYFFVCIPEGSNSLYTCNINTVHTLLKKHKIQHCATRTPISISNQCMDMGLISCGRGHMHDHIFIDVIVL